jgi:hypothetical protein
MKLIDLVKDKIPENDGIISDSELLVLNRRDFLYGETSVASSFLAMFSARNVTYEMYAIIDFIYSCLWKIKSNDKLVIHQLSQTMTLPAIAVSVLVSESASVTLHAPRGFEKVTPADSYSKQLFERFISQEDKNFKNDLLLKELKHIHIVLCNASNEAEVVSGLKFFEKVQRGVLIIKGYGRAKAPNCGEIVMSTRMNIHCSLAGYGSVVSL